MGRRKKVRTALPPQQVQEAMQGGELNETAFKEFVNSIAYRDLRKQLLPAVQYPENFFRRVWDRAFWIGYNKKTTP